MNDQYQGVVRFVMVGICILFAFVVLGLIGAMSLGLYMLWEAAV